MPRLEYSLAGESCSIIVGEELLADTAHTVVPAGSAVIITNPPIGQLHASRIVSDLESHGTACDTIEIPEGEKSKTLATVDLIYDRLARAKIDRGTTVLGLGGGVVGDIAGFVAATYLRGLDFIQVPTTLLAMVDSSIGGKVGVDHPLGKNLIGAWKTPRAVLTDTSTLCTLPDAEWRAGMAEVLKHGIIGDAGLVDLLMAGDVRKNVSEWLPRAIAVKVDIVTRDPFEGGERATLNLGHTFGHAIEQVSSYEMRHGDAVAIGLVCAARLAALHGVAEDCLPSRIEQQVGHLGLAVRVPKQMAAEAILEAMQSDKKRKGKRLRFVLPRRIGQVEVFDDVQDREVMTVIEGLREN